jgi:hypothetical protein
MHRRKLCAVSSPVTLKSSRRPAILTTSLAHDKPEQRCAAVAQIDQRRQSSPTSLQCSHCPTATSKEDVGFSEVVVGTTGELQREEMDNIAWDFLYPRYALLPVVLIHMLISFNARRATCADAISIQTAGHCVVEWMDSYPSSPHMPPSPHTKGAMPSVATSASTTSRQCSPGVVPPKRRRRRMKEVPRDGDRTGAAMRGDEAGRHEVATMAGVRFMAKVQPGRMRT